ncbi:GNAT family N-acetyltransferase [Sphingobacterium faecale]|uniref:GNAT family N-acetyltransferase n=1 Tax=Sphingobacterium faecale TaxID=2803775 RepID=A0ABS1R4T4_9SPHI|nr:GNAT family N-acetyltransferase [Sphingobacterium faecale]MBL1408836.1 GNAT family N-acetyltransferase [Sphingobacterium faecale]
MYIESLNPAYALELLTADAQLPYPLLLLADETRYAIDKYVFDSDVYVLKEGARALAVCCLYRIDDSTLELKNIAVSEELQGKGIGSVLIREIVDIARKAGYRTLIVGTADCGVDQIRFYERAGFVMYAVKKDFFIHNYEAPIVENGVQLRDMVMLRMEL